MHIQTNLQVAVKICHRSVIGYSLSTNSVLEIQKYYLIKYIQQTRMDYEDKHDEIN